ncbi:MAG: hypothetical protein FWG70_06280 [Oscillospiraceae bacterium]|nr:hypothetical protein [Oscillospiraceae bacterium]
MGLFIYLVVLILIGYFMLIVGGIYLAVAVGILLLTTTVRIFWERITMVNSAILSLGVGFLLFTTNFQENEPVSNLNYFNLPAIHPVFCILAAVGVFVLTHFLQQTKIGFWVFAVLMSVAGAILVATIVHELTNDIIWSVSAGACTVALCIVAHLRARKINNYGYIENDFSPAKERMFNQTDEYSKTVQVEKDENERRQQEFNDRVDQIIKKRKQSAESLQAVFDVVHKMFQDDKINCLENTFFKDLATEYNILIELTDSFIKQMENADNAFEQNKMLDIIDKKVDLADNYYKKAQNKLNEIFINQKENKDAKTNTFNLFDGCDTIEKLKKRYKALSKAYHPDTEVGDTILMQQLNNEYERLEKEMMS